MLKYLNLAQSTDAYGNIVAYPITEKYTGMDFLLAVGPKGVSIYQQKENGEKEYYLKHLFAFEDITRGHWLQDSFKLHLRKELEPCSFRFKSTKSNNKKISRTMECYCRFIMYLHVTKNAQQPTNNPQGLVKL